MYKARKPRETSEDKFSKICNDQIILETNYICIAINSHSCMSI